MTSRKSTVTWDNKPPKGYKEIEIKLKERDEDDTTLLPKRLKLLDISPKNENKTRKERNVNATKSTDT